MLPALGVAPPFWQWGAKEVAIDTFHHLVYASATSVADAALGCWRFCGQLSTTSPLARSVSWRSS